ncbi:MFS polyamine transporter [Chiua virens]|nr:MFS polyamine transporter [Chiua virens]
MDSLNTRDLPNASELANADVSPTVTRRGSRLSNDQNLEAHHTSIPVDSEPSPGGSGNNDMLIVDWDGPDDLQNPKNWSFRRKWAAIAIVSGFTFISPVSSSMVAPATSQLAAELGIHNEVIIAFTTSIFILANAIGPLFLGPLSEIYGRSRVVQLANLWYLVWNLVCGFAQNESQLLAFRFLAGLGGSAPLAIGGGVLGDCWLPEERGQAIAVYSLAPLLGSVIGPITGAWIAERSTWRWVFWSTTIVDAAVQALGLIFLQETFAPLLLERKAKKIRKSLDLEKGPYREVRTIFDGNQDRFWQAIFAKSMIRPFALFVREPIIQLLGIYMAYLYGTIYLFLTTIPSIFEGIYNQPVGIAGLHYLALGIGLIGALQINARTMDRIYVYLKHKNGGIRKPEFRLPAMFVGTILLPIGLLITGWTVQARTYWIVPDVGIVLIGAGVILNFQVTQNYIVDVFTLYAASAFAAVYCFRSLAGCGFPLFAPAMYSALGFGKGDTVLGVVAIVLGCPAPFILWYYGERIRNASRHAARQKTPRNGCQLDEQRLVNDVTS